MFSAPTCGTIAFAYSWGQVISRMVEDEKGAAVGSCFASWAGSPISGRAGGAG